MAVVKREQEFKPLDRLWFHVKVMYFLLCLLFLLYLVSLFVVWKVNNINVGRSEIAVFSPVYQRKTSTGLLRIKRNLHELKNAEDAGYKSKARKGIKNRNLSAQSDGDWVWMSSFSRIPSHILQGFCASTKDYCPTGFPGVPGLPGKKGENGKAGDNGIPGKDGVRGADGSKGTIGQKGELGIQGPQGAKGTMGLAGEKGSNGENGATGRRGEKGDKGDKGEVQVRNCSCPQGPKGSKGEPGYVSSDSLVTWMDFDKKPNGNGSSSSDLTSHTTSESCRIRLISKPHFQKQTGTTWGAWLRDLSTNESFNKVWITRHLTDNVLYEYSTVTNFRKDRISKIYELQYNFIGTGHVVFKGNFYYHRAGYNEIVQYSLSEEVTTARLTVDGATSNGGVFLYSTEYNYFDFSVDENGLWAIYSNESDTETITVAKINESDMSFSSVINISVERRQYGNGFVACGALYLVRDTRAKTTRIDYAYDLFKRQTIPVNLKFINPFQMNNMVTYLPVIRNILSWDKGNQLIYNVTV